MVFKALEFHTFISKERLTVSSQIGNARGIDIVLKFSFCCFLFTAFIAHQSSCHSILNYSHYQQDP